MATCRGFNCDSTALGADAPANVRSSFCSVQCEVRFDHIRDDARDAMMEDRS